MFGLFSNNNTTPQPALMSQGVNRTAQLPPQVQSDVAKMRNNGVPEDRINDYITNRMQYFSTLAPAPVSAPAPALISAAAASNTQPVTTSLPPTKQVNLGTVMPNPMPPTTPPPALTNKPTPPSAGVLSNPVGAVASAMNQQGRRNTTQLAVERPDLGIDTNEMLMRVGGKGLANAANGGLAAYGAMFDEYGNVQDQRRNNALAEYNADYQAQQDEQDRIDALAKAEAKKKEVKAPEQSPYMEATLNAIEAIEASVAEGEDDWINPFDNVTGLIGAGLRLVPGTPAYDTNAQIETVISSIGFDRLQKMRDDSPTGGALGQVSERELDQLNASLGNLRQSQSRASFKRNLALVKKHYLASVEAIRQQQIEYARMNGLSVPASATNAGSSSQSGSALPTVGQSTSIGGVTVTRIK